MNLAEAELKDILDRNGLEDNDANRALATLWFHSLEIVGPFHTAAVLGTDTFRVARNEVTRKLFPAELQVGADGNFVMPRFTFDLWGDRVPFEQAFKMKPPKKRRRRTAKSR